MKKTLILVFFAAIMVLPEYSEAAIQNTKNQTESISKQDTFGGGRRGKSGRYRKKKGFMWGLFKGKSQCDCPKH
jgi:hypothetical protein